jgi:DNA-binding transcriptional LysR family regulator
MLVMTLLCVPARFQQGSFGEAVEIADLKTLITVVERGGITNAAKELNRVPSGVTTRIIQLEESLGVQLFLREKKRLMVTPKGLELCDYAKKIMYLLAEAERRVKTAEPGGLFRIGAMESTLASRLPGPLAKLHLRYEDLRLELTTGTSRCLFELLLDNRLDAVFIADPPPDERIEHALVFEEKLVLIASAGHKPICGPRDTEGATALVFKDGCSYRNRLLNWFRACGLEPGRTAELASYHAIMGAAAAGMGIGIVPVSVVELFPKQEALSMHQFDHPSANVATALVWRKGMTNANITALQNCVRENRPARYPERQPRKQARSTHQQYCSPD